jgi:hypothetical protein
MAVLLEDRLLLGLAQRPPKRTLAVIHLRLDVSGELFADVVLLVRGQKGLDGAHVAIE